MRKWNSSAKERIGNSGKHRISEGKSRKMATLHSLFLKTLMKSNFDFITM